MSFIDTFTNFLHPQKQSTSTVSIEGDKILPYLFSLVNNQAVLLDEINRYKKAQVLPPRERELAYIPIYLACEAVILGQKPPVVTQIFTRQSLRQAVSTQIHLAQLSKAFQILFLPENWQVLLLCEMSLDPLINYIRANLGSVTLQTIVPQAASGTVFASLHVLEQGVVYDDVYKAVEQVAVSQVIINCQRFCRVLYETLDKTIGGSKTENLLMTSYSFIKSLYGFEFSSILLDVLPGEILSNERVQLLSRQELEKQVSEATQSEKEKRELSERLTQELQAKISEVGEQNKKLQDTQQAMVTLLKNAKELEIALQQERDRAQAIINSMGEGMLAVDSSLHISYINPVAEKLLGLEKTHGIGQSVPEILSLIYDPTGEEQTAVLSTAMAQGIKTVFHLGEHFLLKPKNGEIFPVTLTLTPFQDNNGAVLLFHDRTGERLVKHKIEQEVALRTRELMEEQAKLTASINSLNRAFIMTDPAGTILLTNTVLNSLLGVIRSPWTLELVQKKLGTTVDLVGAFTTCVNDKQPIMLDKIQFGRKFLRISLNPFFLPDYGTFLGIVIQLEDITDDTLLQRTRDEFFSIASHELRTPLTSIRGNISLIKKFFPQMMKDQLFSGMVEDIHTSSIRLIKIVNDFLNLSRLEMGKTIFKKELFDIIPILQDCEKEMAGLMAQKQLIYKLETNSMKQAFVYADKDRLKEVIINLLSNAIKYTEKGGITLTLGRISTGISIQIKDTGRGISVKNQGLLFRKFQQASDNIITRDTSQSTGLGLYISKLLMQGMGGTIALVSSEENKGATFEITLPVPD